MPKHFHSPVPLDLPSESAKARLILEEFINPSITGNPGKELPSRVLAQAKGLIILTVTRFAFLGSIRFGSGVIVIRQSDGNWSPPSSVMTMGGGFGGQVGIELADLVFILKDSRAVQTFLETGTLMLSANFSIAFGPFGRSAELAGAVNTKYHSWMYTFSKTKGLYGGVSVEGGVLVGRNGADMKVYGEKVRAAGRLVNGEVVACREVEDLLRVLNAAEFHPRSGGGLSERGCGIDDGLEDGRAEMPADGVQQNPPPPAEIHSVPIPAPAPAPVPPVELHAESAQIQAAELPTEPSSTSSLQQTDQASQLIDRPQPEEEAINPPQPQPSNGSDIPQNPQPSSPGETDEAQTKKEAQSSPLADGSHTSQTGTLQSPETTVSAR